MFHAETQSFELYFSASPRICVEHFFFLEC